MGKTVKDTKTTSADSLKIKKPNKRHTNTKISTMNIKTSCILKCICTLFENDNKYSDYSAYFPKEKVFEYVSETLPKRLEIPIDVNLIYPVTRKIAELCLVDTSFGYEIMIDKLADKIWTEITEIVSLYVKTQSSS
jgi:hypothetical protein